jgi:DNA 3'-phosphatase
VVKMPRVFQGCHFMLVGMSAAQKRIISQNIVTEGGVVVPSSASLFGPTEINPSVTHILVENKAITYESLCKLSNCISIPAVLPVIHTSWVISCCHKKSFVDTATFKVSAPRADEMVDLTSECGSVSPPPVAEPMPIALDTSVAVVTCDTSGDINVKFKTVCDHTAPWNECTKEKIDLSLQITPLIETGINFRQYPFNTWQHREDILFNFARLKIAVPASSSSAGGNVRYSLLPVIAFDMDHTIVTTKSGNVHPKDNSDWRIWHDDVVAKLHSLPRCTFDGDELFETHILFVSNQGGLLKKKDGIGGFCSKIDKIRSTIGLPISFICAMDNNNMYRKPLPGMWEFFQAFMRYNYNELTASANNVDTKFNAELLLFVGDAAGRAAEGTRKKDFSDSDLKFAMNVGTKVLMSAGPFIYLLIRLFLYSS